MQAEYQAIAGPGRRHSKGQLVCVYLLKRHCLCINSIENLEPIRSRFPAHLSENLQNSVWNSGR